MIFFFEKTEINICDVKFSFFLSRSGEQAKIIMQIIK